MEASDSDQRSKRSSSPGSPSAKPTRDQAESLSASALADRLDEEVSRAIRHGTALSCLIVAIDQLDEPAARSGAKLPPQELECAGAALRGDLRRFDRVGRLSENELLVILPGADGPRAEIVAKRVIDRLRTIKLERGGVGGPLRVSVGLAAWQEGLDGEQLVAQAREAARRDRNGLANGFGSA